MTQVFRNDTAQHNVILGIDPGSRVMGYALVKCVGNKRVILCMDALVLGNKTSMEERLKLLFQKVTELVDTYHPEILAIEAPFYGKNVQSMLKLGKAQGVAIAAALAKGIPFIEYAPRRIKQSITGKGAASKEQVAMMLQHMIPFQDFPKYLDATDALAVAVCHSLQHRFSEKVPKEVSPKEVGKKKSGSWTKFLSENPDRIQNKSDKR